MDQEGRNANPVVPALAAFGPGDTAHKAVQLVELRLDHSFRLPLIPIKAIFDDYYDHIVGPFWPPEGRHADNGYSELPWPFPRIDFGVSELAVDWTLDEFAGYIGTWSATARYRKARGQDPVPALHARLAAVWGLERRTLRWPLRVLAGRIA